MLNGRQLYMDVDTRKKKYEDLSDKEKKSFLEFGLNSGFIHPSSVNPETAKRLSIDINPVTVTQNTSKPTLITEEQPPEQGGFLSSMGGSRTNKIKETLNIDPAINHALGRILSKEEPTGSGFKVGGLLDSLGISKTSIPDKIGPVKSVLETQPFKKQIYDGKGNLNTQALITPTEPDNRLTGGNSLFKSAAKPFTPQEDQTQPIFNNIGDAFAFVGNKASNAIKKVFDVGGELMDEVKASNLDIDINLLQYDMMHKGETPEKLAKLDQLNQERDQINTDTSGAFDAYKEKGVLGLFEKGVKGAAQMLPLIYRSTLEAMDETFNAALVGAGIGFAAGNAAGITALTPEEIVTVPAGALFGAKTGFAAGSADFMMRVEGGSSYQELVGQGVDPDIAKPIATGVGILNGAVEMGAHLLFLKSIPGVKQALDSVKKKAVQEGVKQIVKTYVTNVAAETSEEIIQEGIQIIGMKIAEKYHETLSNPIDIIDKEQAKSRMLEAGIQAFLSMAVLGGVSIVGGNAVRNGTIRYSDNKQAHQVQKTFENMNDEINAFENDLADNPKMDNRDSATQLSIFRSMIENTLSRGLFKNPQEAVDTLAKIDRILSKLKSEPFSQVVNQYEDFINKTTKVNQNIVTVDDDLVTVNDDGIVTVEEDVVPGEQTKQPILQPEQTPTKETLTPAAKEVTPDDDALGVPLQIGDRILLKDGRHGMVTDVFDGNVYFTPVNPDATDYLDEFDYDFEDNEESVKLTDIERVEAQDQTEPETESDKLGGLEPYVDTEKYGRLEVMGVDGSTTIVKNEKGTVFNIGTKTLNDMALPSQKTNQIEPVMESDKLDGLEPFVDTEAYGRLEVLDVDGSTTTVKNEKGSVFSIGTKTLNDMALTGQKPKQIKPYVHELPDNTPIDTSGWKVMHNGTRLVKVNPIPPHNGKSKKLVYTVPLEQELFVESDGTIRPRIDEHYQLVQTVTSESLLREPTDEELDDYNNTPKSHFSIRDLLSDIKKVHTKLEKETAQNEDELQDEYDDLMGNLRSIFKSEGPTERKMIYDGLVKAIKKENAVEFSDYSTEKTSVPDTPAPAKAPIEQVDALDATKASKVDIEKAFANSKVRDTNGKLKILFHGTPSLDFTTFDLSKGGVMSGSNSSKKGFYFTDNKEISDLYRGDVYGRDPDMLVFKDFVYNLPDSELVTFAKSIKALEGGYMFENDKDEGYEDTKQGLWTLSKEQDRVENIDGLMWIANQVGDTKYTGWEKVQALIDSGKGRTIEANLNITNPYIVEGAEFFQDDIFLDAIEEAISKGHDGVIFKDVEDGVRHLFDKSPPSGDVYMVFNPDQVAILNGVNLVDTTKSDTKLATKDEQPKASSVDKTNSPDSTETTKQKQEVKQETESDIAVHAGDLGKSEHYGKQVGSLRSTGHFGTGTYFVSSESRFSTGSSYKDRPIHKINLSPYNLFRPSNVASAHALHNALAFINKNILELNTIKDGKLISALKQQKEDLNDLELDEVKKLAILSGLSKDDDLKGHYDTPRLESLRRRIKERVNYLSSSRVDYLNFEGMLKRSGLNVADALKTLDKISDEVSKLNYLSNDVHFSDSPSTRFMKHYGYDGVDVRHIEAFDNTDYGTVVYDLKTNDAANQNKVTKDPEKVSKTPGTTKESPKKEPLSAKTIQSLKGFYPIELYKKGRITPKKLMPDDASVRLGDYLLTKHFAIKKDLVTPQLMDYALNHPGYNPDSFNDAFISDLKLLQNYDAFAFNNDVVLLTNISDKVVTIDRKYYDYAMSLNAELVEPVKSDLKPVVVSVNGGVDGIILQFKTPLLNASANEVISHIEGNTLPSKESDVDLTKPNLKGFKRVEYTIQTKDGPEKVTGRGFGDFGIQTKNDAYYITHIPSGILMRWVSHLDDARLTAKYLELNNVIDYEMPPTNTLEDNAKLLRQDQKLKEALEMAKDFGYRTHEELLDGKGHSFTAETYQDFIDLTHETPGKKDTQSVENTVTNPKSGVSLIQEDKGGDLDVLGEQNSSAPGRNPANKDANGRSGKDNKTPSEVGPGKRNGNDSVSERPLVTQDVLPGTRESRGNRETKTPMERLGDADSERTDVGGYKPTDDTRTQSNQLTPHLEEDAGFSTSQGDVIDLEKMRDQPLAQENYRLPNDLDLDQIKPNIEDNMLALETLMLIESENRLATAYEKTLLAKYKGWGGLKRAFIDPEPKAKLQKLLSKDDYKLAERTIHSAHFTPIKLIDIMYDALKQLGAKAGQLLEPSMGVGNMFMRLPKNNPYTLYGVEIDNVTGRIAKQLYPTADIQIRGFQDTEFHENSFDVIIGNVPYVNMMYRHKSHSFPVHDYFFARSMDTLKPGGIMMFLTSLGTMDKTNKELRSYLLEQGDLIAAYRLPDTTFKQNANTMANADLIILRKRKDGEAVSQVKWLNTVDFEGQSLNEYFKDNPSHVLGEMSIGSDQHGEKIIVKPGSVDFKTQLSQLIKKLSPSFDADKQVTQIKTEAQRQALEVYEPNTFVLKDDKVFYYDGDMLEEATFRFPVHEGAVKNFIELRNAYLELVDLMLNAGTDSAKKKARLNLNVLYDRFVKYEKKGYRLNSRSMKGLLKQDITYPRVAAIENYNSETKAASKADVFKVDTITAFKEPTFAKTPEQALSLSLTLKGNANLDYMAKLLDMPTNEAANRLKDQLILMPNGEYELIDRYLSGNVVKKLQAAKEAAKTNKDFNHNVKLLESVQPERITFDKITIPLGSPWISEQIMKEFFVKTMELRNPTVIYDQFKGTWVLSEFDRNTKTTKEFGISHTVSAEDILNKIMNQQPVFIYKYVNDQKMVDQKATADANAAAERIRDAFNAYLLENDSVRENLEDAYNERFNSSIEMNFERLAGLLTFPTLSDQLEFMAHQKKAIARIIFNGNTLLAHGVGAGKTYAMIGAAYEGKQMGLFQKPLFVVPNHKVTDFAQDFYKAYPQANLLIVGTDEFKPINRMKAVGKIAAGNWDAVIMPESRFTQIPLSPQAQIAHIDNEIEIVRDALTRFVDASQRSNSRFQSNLVKSLEALENKRKLQIAELDQDKGMTFEETGVDAIFVDEAHHYKNLSFYTKHSQITGINANGSDTAFDMFLKTTYLNNKGGRVIFATATPITNSMAEVYTMTRFISPQQLKEQGVEAFDAWAATFGLITHELELKGTTQQYAEKTRFAKFINVRELSNSFREFADTVLTEDVIDTLPTHEIIRTKSETKRIYQMLAKWLSAREKEITGRPEPGEDNHVVINGDGRAFSVDPRLLSSVLGIDPDSLDFNDSKINNAVRNIVKEYKDGMKKKTTQYVFLDQGVKAAKTKSIKPPRRQFDLYTDMINKLVEAGVKKEEIATIHDANTDIKKEKLFEAVNNGSVRILIGSTGKMGEGMNTQKLAIALHHIDVPYRPSDLEQREGRIIRQKNTNPHVRIYHYIQEGSFDVFMWNLQLTKAKFIKDFYKGNVVENEVDDISGELSNEELALALSTGNPKIKERINLDRKVKELEKAKEAHQRYLRELNNTLIKNPSKIEVLEKEIKDTEHDLKMAKDFFDAPFKITVLGKVYDTNLEIGGKIKNITQLNEAKADIKREAITALHEALTGTIYDKPLAQVGGFTVLKKSEFNTFLRGKHDYHFEVKTSPDGNLTKMLNAIKVPGLEGNIAYAKKLITDKEKEIDIATLKQNTPFAKNDELVKSKQQLALLDAELKNVDTQSEVKLIDDHTKAFDRYFDVELTSNQNQPTIRKSENVEYSRIAVRSETLKHSKKAVDQTFEEELDSPTKFNHIAYEKPDTDFYNTEKTKFIPEEDANYTKEPKPFHRIIHDLKKHFKIDIRNTRFRAPKGVMGFYRGAGVNEIATRFAEDLFTIAHEIGHHLDNIHAFSDLEAMNDIIKNLDPEFKELYKEEQYAKEAIAEFVRLYLVHPVAAESLSASFYETFEKELTAKERFTMQQAQRDFQRWRSASTVNQVQSTIYKRRDSSYRRFFSDLAAVLKAGKDGKVVLKDATADTVTRRIMEMRQFWFDSFTGMKTIDNFWKRATGASLDDYGLMSPHTMAEWSLFVNPQSAWIATNDLFSPKMEILDVGMKQVFEPIKEKEFDKFSTYTKLIHSIDRAKIGKATFPIEIMPHQTVVIKDEALGIKTTTLEFDISIVQAAIRELELRYPHFKDVNDKRAKWWQTFVHEWVVKGTRGAFMDEEMFERLVEVYPHYVANYRYTEDIISVNGKPVKINNPKRGMSDIYNPLRRSSALGGDGTTYDPIESMILDVQRYVTAVRRWEVMQSIHEIYEQAAKANLTEGISHLITQVPASVSRNVFNATHIKEKILYEITEDAYEDKVKSNSQYDRVKDLIKEGEYTKASELIFKDTGADIANVFDSLMANYITYFTANRKDKENNIVSHLIPGGEVVHYKINDPLLLESVLAVSYENHDKFMAIAKKIRRVQQSLYTYFDPLFPGRNTARDTVDYLVASDGKGLKHVRKLADSLVANIAKKGDHAKKAKLYRMMGGEMSSAVGTNINRLRIAHSDIQNKSLLTQAYKHPLLTIEKGLGKYNDLPEMLPRSAEFMTILEKETGGLPPTYHQMIKAFLAAQEVTVFFARKGLVMDNSFANLILFFNPFLQGVDKFGRMHGKVKIKRTLLRTMLFVMLPALLIKMWHDDDPEYEDISTFMKDTHWLMGRTSDGRIIRLAAPRELSIYKIATERLYDYYKTNDPIAFRDMTRSIMYAIGPDLSTIFTPVLEASKNQRWSGGPITTYSDELLPYSEQYDENTTYLAKAVADSLFMINEYDEKYGWLKSPKRIDYILQQYTGGAGNLLRSLISDNKGVGVFEGAVRRFTIDTAYSNQIITDFYDYREILSGDRQTFKVKGVKREFYDEEMYDAFNAAYKEMSDARQLSYTMDPDGWNELKKSERAKIKRALYNVVKDYADFKGDQNIIKQAEQYGFTKDFNPDTPLDERLVSLLQRQLKLYQVEVARPVVKMFQDKYGDQ